MSLRRWLPYGAIALAAHLGALAALRGPVRAPAPVPAELTVTDLDLEPAPTPVETQPVLPPQPSQEVLLAHTTSTAATRTTRETTPAPHEAIEPTARSAPTAAPSSDGWTFDPRRPADVLAPTAIARAVRDAAPATEAPTETATGVSRTGGLAEGLDAHDAAIGLGRGGPVVSALEVAAASSAGAPDGKATFEFTIDAGGHISVALLSASAASKAWAQVGAAAGASLDPARLRIPPGAHGWHVVATVEAKVQYPNGLDPKKLGTHVEGTPDIALEENKHRANVEDPPIIFKKMPHVTLAHAGKVCSIALTIGLTFGSPITGGCDPTNIGALTTRVVRSHVVSEGRL